MLEFLFRATPLSFFVQDFWRDEAFSVILAKKNVLDIILLTSKDFNPPLYYELLHFWMKLFGQSEVAVRSVSLFFYLGTVLGVFLIMENIFKWPEKKAHWWILLFFFNPLVLYNAFEARMYTMLAFFATFSWYYLKTQKPKQYLIFTILGLYTHYFMLLVLASQIFYIFTSQLLKKAIKLKDYKEVGVAILLFAPWLIFVAMMHHGTTDQFWILPPQFNTYNHMPSLLYTGYEFGFEFFDKYLWPLTILLNVISLYGLYLLRKQNKEDQDKYVFLSAWTFIPVFIVFGLSFVKPLFLPRYLIASSVGLSILLMYVLNEFPKFARIVLTTMLILYSCFYISLFMNNRAKAPMKKVVGEIKSLATRNEPLYVVNELDFFTAQYYFDPNRVYIYAKPYKEIPTYTGKILIPEDRIVHKLPLYPKKAFVLKDDQSYSIEALY